MVPSCGSGDSSGSKHYVLSSKSSFKALYSVDSSSLNDLTSSLLVISDASTFNSGSSLDTVDSSSSVNDTISRDKLHSLSNTVDIVAMLSQTAMNLIPPSLFTSLGYPQNAVFRFTGYKGLQDKEKLQTDMKRSACNSGSHLVTYSSHTRLSRYVFNFKSNLSRMLQWLDSSMTFLF